MIKHLFTTPVLTGDIPNFEEVLKEIKSSTENIQRYLRTDVWNDNIFSTNGAPPCICSELGLNVTKKAIEVIFNEYLPQTQYSHWNMSLVESWVNVSAHGGFQDMHTHDFKEVVGVLYLDIPKNSGNIELAPLVEFAQFHERESITPYSGMFAIFPGYVRHRVTYNKSSQQRISLAFNYRRTPVNLKKLCNDLV